MNTDSIKVAILSGNYRQAIAEGEKMLAAKGGSAQYDELYYLLGLSLLKEGNYRKAGDYFEIILKEYPGSRFEDESRLGLGDACLLREEFSKAGTIFKDLLDQKPNTKIKAQLLQRLSQVSFNSGDSVGGKQYLDKLEKEFPLNIEPKITRQIQSVKISISSGGDVYSVQVGSFSNKSNAEGLIDKLSASGYSAYLEESSSQGAFSYRVRVGKFNSHREAEDLEKKLALQGYPTKICP